MTYRLAAVAFWLVLAPSLALACPGCVSSPYGDRTFGWAYLILYAAPFVVGTAIAGMLAHTLRRGRGPRAVPPGGEVAPALLPSHAVDKETT